MDNHIFWFAFCVQRQAVPESASDESDHSQGTHDSEDDAPMATRVTRRSAAGLKGSPVNTVAAFSRAPIHSTGTMKRLPALVEPTSTKSCLKRKS